MMGREYKYMLGVWEHIENHGGGGEPRLLGFCFKILNVCGYKQMVEKSDNWT